MSDPHPERRSDTPLGIALILVGAAAAAASTRIHTLGLGGNHDPGPKAFPLALALCLVVGGAVLVGKRLWFRREPSPTASPLDPAPTPNTAGISTPLRIPDAIILVLGLTIYAAAIPWLGFSAATLLFATGMMLRLGTRPRVALASSVLLVVAIRALFVSLFKVQLPTGSLGLPF